MIRVVLVDDHELVRAGIAALLATQPDLQVVGQASDGEQALELIRRERPDVVLMDFSMPGVNGAEATRWVCHEAPGICVIGVSMYTDAARVHEMCAAGVSAYLFKGCPPDELLDVIRRCHAAAADDAPGC